MDSKILYPFVPGAGRGIDSRVWYKHFEAQDHEAKYYLKSNQILEDRSDANLPLLSKPLDALHAPS
jgi:hypothetical protein